MGRSKKSSGDWAYESVYGPFLDLAGLGAGKNQPNPSASRQALMERMYRRILTEMAMNRFKWKGMPNSVDTRYLELTLFNNALSVFYFDNRYNRFLSLAGSGAGVPNFYQNPTRFIVNGMGSFPGRELAARDVVPIWANYLRVPDLDVVLVYARKFAELDMTIEINSKNARMPKLLGVTENTKLTGENIVRQIDEGNPLISVQLNSQFGSASIGDFLTSLDLGVNPDNVEKLHILRARLWGECMGLLGLDFANQDKKERLVAAEVGANDEQVDAMRRVSLNARQEAARRINEKFGDMLDEEVSVDFHVADTTLPATTAGELDPGQMSDEKESE